VVCDELVNAILVKERIADKLNKNVGHLIEKTDFSLIYDSGLKIIFCGKNAADRLQQNHNAKTIKNITLSTTPIFYSLMLIFWCLVILQLTAILAPSKFCEIAKPVIEIKNCSS
jgi:hypothetical protein